jgi:hypothetical protein
VSPDFDPESLLRIAIHDALLQAGHDGLADAALRAAGYFDLIRRAGLAAEALRAGDMVERGTDGLIYPVKAVDFAKWIGFAGPTVAR